MPQDNQSPYDDSSEEASPTQQEDNTDAGKTALVPKSLFSGELKPGDKFEFEVVTVRGDEVEVRYSGSEKQEESKPQPQEQPAQPDGGMRSMLEA